jgi:hypothetical protein
MAPKYDIFKKTPSNSFVWLEAVEDIHQAKKRLVSLGWFAADDYRVWDSSRQEFINLMDDCA